MVADGLKALAEGSLMDCNSGDIDDLGNSLLEKKKKTRVSP